MELNALSPHTPVSLVGWNCGVLLAAQSGPVPSNFQRISSANCANTQCPLTGAESRISLVTHLASICMRYSPIGCRDCNGNCTYDGMRCNRRLAPPRHSPSTWHIVFVRYYLT